MIYTLRQVTADTSRLEPVKVVGGEYRRLVAQLGLGFYVETYKVRAINDPVWEVERAISELNADGGADEIRQAAAVFNEEATRPRLHDRQG